MRLSWIVIAALAYQAHWPTAAPPPQVVVIAPPAPPPVPVPVWRLRGFDLTCPPNGPCYRPCMATDAGCWSY